MTPMRNLAHKSQKKMLIDSFEKVSTKSPKISLEESFMSRSMLLGLNTSLNKFSPKKSSSKENILNDLEEYENHESMSN